MEGTTSQDLLALHPSVQDLDIDTHKLNARKAHVHNLLINHGPLHLPSEVGGQNAETKKKVPKGQTVSAARNEENLKKAAAARLIPSEIGNPAATSTKTKAVPPGVSTGTTNSTPPVIEEARRTSSSSSTSITKRSSVLVASQKQSQPQGAAVARTDDAAAQGVLPATTKLALLPSVGARRPQSIVTSLVSYEGTDAESVSVYSCSCCHAKPPSSVATSALLGAANGAGASDYDNLTSVSQRPSNHPSHATSISSSKLRKLEDELKQERQDRLRTQDELEQIKKRQQFLLSRLTKEERDQLRRLMSGAPS